MSAVASLGRQTSEVRSLRAMLACAVALGAAPMPSFAESADDVRSLREELTQLREESGSRIRALEQRITELEAERPRPPESSSTASTNAASPPGDRLQLRTLTNRVVITGWGAAGYDWQQESGDNTFGATAAPILLFRPIDRVLFEMEPEFELDSDGGTEVNLEYAQADVVVNDYATMVAGKFLLPFGTFIQQLHPAWINKLVSNPLPYLEGEEGGLIPFSDVGVQVRGGTGLFQSEGVDLGYTVFGSNGPRYEGDELGAPLVANNVDLNRGKAFGGRLSVHPFPLAKEIGRLEIGASTYNGIWDEGNDDWFRSWGLDLAYQLDTFELRGEYLQTRRSFTDRRTDRRDGWYLQAAYKLSHVPVAPLDRMELVLRWSGIAQDAIADEEDAEERPGDFQQIALGLNYWLSPSVVGKLEYDFDYGHDATDDQIFRALIAVGF